ncbi:MAG: hypothetical protein IKO55_18680 [Kiritimatiellae bacterium]|nr:hypothetical protein [Kiritimatiellia bacterium]
MEISRKRFIGGGIAAAAIAGTPQIAPATDALKRASSGLYTPLIPHDAAPRNRRPYTGLDWTKCRQITTTSHGHCETQRQLDEYLRHGYGFMTISNYYPSAPTYPGGTITRYHYHFHSDWPLMVKGVRTEGPFDWNKIIEPIKDGIDTKFRSEFPFDPRKDVPMFPNWPKKMLEAPNAEHHTFVMDDGKVDPYIHLNGLGSFYKSGNIDKYKRYGTRRLGYCAGTGEHWRTSMDRMLKELMFADGGGVTINHPSWSGLKRDLLLEMLDHDPRVLGVEILEERWKGNSERYWDWALSTGRQCFGFFVPDHSIFDRDCGANILVVPEATVHECLKAYRQGNFYGSLHAMGELRFTGIAFDGRMVTASTDKPSMMQVITAMGVVKETKGHSIAWTVPTGLYFDNGPKMNVFARVKAFAIDGSDEIIWSQPYMLM